jgi:hypothetical protein
LNIGGTKSVILFLSVVTNGTANHAGMLTMSGIDREYGAIQQAGLNPGYMFRGAGALDDNWAPQPSKLTTAGNVPSPIIPHYGSGGM